MRCKVPELSRRSLQCEKLNRRNKAASSSRPRETVPQTPAQVTGNSSRRAEETWKVYAEREQRGDMFLLFRGSEPQWSMSWPGAAGLSARLTGTFLLSRWRNLIPGLISGARATLLLLPT
ncbi:hypothetical protein KOW79_020468 [Hemibagrus wyckioides]|uniref:Uncharacterized protein n=1 Tax=Hemibagrus wyckioides TaxID=337641 RepID=A0A9D3N744_9TELE|nr:hypothetical protein KOW79_020468 [Hemibagrus wyckioides]